MKSEIQNPKSEILVVGAGPAGASLAIRLAEKDFEVTLIERDNFPRQKLCGEFISPECLEHFRELNVLDEMFSVGGDRIAETVFYAPNGKNVSVSSEWFNAEAQNALSISRAEMDFRLLERAKKVGVKILEETQVVGLLSENGKICGVKAKNKRAETFEIAADLTIDATGRANVLGKSAEKAEGQRSKVKGRRSKLVGFKTHLKNVRLEKGRCEIYFFRGGYGGLSFVENNLANHCFLIKADVVKEFNGQTDKLVEEVIFQNKRAFETMRDAEAVFDWLAVSVESFGRKNLNPAPNLLSVGDAAAFIDPFTGSGMLMALQSAKILAEIIAENRFSTNRIAEIYETAHRRNFQNRLRICALMRRAAFMPNLAKLIISTLGFSEKSREILARATRRSFLFDKNK
ncbi:MAG: NAD(P)/FAD-dependent oxidoreductase [Pyrinomonadaceae bacterium]|nr:NAD(P)/FAD-dependent oxidoreductase [Pyrinomonadaceae bacterium]